MKVAVTGSHGVGKSTLINDILNYLNREAGLSRSFKLLEETPRQAFKLGFPINENNTPETQLWIFAKQLEMELVANDDYIVYKCYVDLLAYALHFFKERQDLINTLKDISSRAANKYDLVIYLPTGEFPIEDDGVRSTDTDFQERVDKLVLKILVEFGINYVKITGNKEERLRRAIELIKVLL